MTTAAPRRLSYDLNEEMLKAIGEEFSPRDIASRFATALGRRKSPEKVAREIFGDYGKKWMKRSMELGEKYSDAAYETLKKAIDKSGFMRFPLVPERFVEIAYLSVMSFLALPIVQNNGQKLAYKVTSCDIYQTIAEKSGKEVASLHPCRYACLSALETLFGELNIPVKVELEAAMPREGYCQFSATKV